MILSCVSDAGKVKLNNEDYILINGEENIYILADGIGGTSGGEVASKEASQFMHTLVSEFLKKNSFEDLDADVINSFFYETNAHLYRLKENDILLNRMGTTLILCICNGSGGIVIAHVGDSRVYLIDDSITQLTKDHSRVQSLIDDGLISPQEARNHTDKHEITKALGPVNNMGMNYEKSDLIKPQIIYKQMKFNDMLLMCSDGLSDMVDDEEIWRIVKDSQDIDSASNALLKRACQNGGKDNISVVLVTEFIGG